MFAHLQVHMQMENHYSSAHKGATYKEVHIYGIFQQRSTFCGVFGVSRSAAAIRLEQLGYLNRKKDYEYRDPLEVWP